MKVSYLQIITGFVAFTAADAEEGSLRNQGRRQLSSSKCG
eukprot:CAMPEP_0172552052 /NCGR_PEP_ID=MMETSP1067-20121228/43491_1 /TAXON_ID=265564 ORGANISM="Thalassiosira punctigera, Strain Tpunct2005C2" /NCGR_SAMPLE_ID=MMETSP1067 /ASSEMBLY_ACC=CAM_ASM_000444 /LENGTH=39 /DNA_ID= /DNA_START= /DNA_END= /DNA_ORIENTATION=